MPAAEVLSHLPAAPRGPALWWPPGKHHQQQGLRPFPVLGGPCLFSGPIHVPCSTWWSPRGDLPNTFARVYFEAHVCGTHLLPPSTVTTTAGNAAAAGTLLPKELLWKRLGVATRAWETAAVGFLMAAALSPLGCSLCHTPLLPAPSATDCKFSWKPDSVTAMSDLLPCQSELSAPTPYDPPNPNHTWTTQEPSPVLSQAPGSGLWVQRPLIAWLYPTRSVGPR